MNIEGQEMETYQIFVFPIGDANITEEVWFHPRAPVLKYQAREYWYDKEVPKNSVAQSDDKEKAKENFVAPISDIEKLAYNLTRHRR